MAYRTHRPVESNEEYLREKRSGKYIGMSYGWMRKSRREGTGPAFARLGRAIVYRKKDLDAFIEDRLQSTEGE